MGNRGYGYAESIANEPVFSVDLDAIFNRIEKVKEARDRSRKMDQEFNSALTDLDLRARASGIGSVSGNAKTGQMTLTPGGVPLPMDQQLKKQELDLMDTFIKQVMPGGPGQAPNGSQTPNGGQPAGGVSSGGATPSSPSSASPQAGLPKGPAVKSASIGPFTMEFDTPSAIMERAGNLRKEMLNNPIVKVQSETIPLVTAAEDVLGRIESGETTSYQAADQVLIIALNKVLDPSVVRESEFDRSKEGLALRNRLIGSLDQLSAGGQGLTLADRREIVKNLQILADARGSDYNRVIDMYTGLSDGYNVPASLVTTGLPKYTPKAPKSSPNPSQQGGVGISYIKEAE